MPTFGLGGGAQPVRPPGRPPVQYQTSGMGGGGGTNTVGLPVLNLPGTQAYSDQYAKWMQTPEAQATFKSEAERQARFGNAIASHRPDVTAAANDAMGGLKADPFDPSGNSRFREAMAMADQPPGPTPMPMTSAGKPPATGPIFQPPSPPSPPTGVNAWQAARSLRQRKPPIIGTGPAKPPQPYAIV